MPTSSAKAIASIAAMVFSCTSLLAQDTTKINSTLVAHTTITETNNTHYFTPAGVIIPGTFLLYGCLKPAVKSIQNLDEKIREQVYKANPTFKTKAADYIMWAPSSSIYLLDAFNVKTKHNFKEHLILDAGSLIVTGGVGLVMRKISGNMEAYTKYGTKFPSGHTANAFRGAEIFHQELKGEHELLSYSGYLVATGVGVLRIYERAHLLTEVLAGAGLGILSTKLTYWIFDRVKRH